MGFLILSCADIDLGLGATWPDLGNTGIDESEQAGPESESEELNKSTPLSFIQIHFPGLEYLYTNTIFTRHDHLRQGANMHTMSDVPISAAGMHQLIPKCR